jgi:CRP-like cAMP-binding protein
MINLSVFRHFVPTHSLSPADRGELARHSYVAGCQPGQVLFHRGDAARTVAYLISGEVELVSELGSRLIAGDTDASRYALANGEKRNVTATCTRAAQVLFIDRNHLDLMLTWAQTGAVEVQDLQQGEAGDWMSAMLRNPAFHRIPPANIAQIIACVEQVEFAAGDTIIRQGEAGDYYYVVTDGICQVLLQDPTGLGERELDRIGQGQGFGEEALVSGDPRNATVRALSRVSLVRLAAQDFTRLLRDPLMHRVDIDALPRGAILVDVRLQEEYLRGHLEGAVNLPLRRLRGEARSMDVSRPLVVYCDTGRRSASATFLLSERGFDARWVDKGVPESRYVNLPEASPPAAG